MNRTPAVALCLLLTSSGAVAATRTYDTGAFEAISVAAGVNAQIALGQTRSVVAETRAGDFDDLQITVQAGVLRIERTRGRWNFFRRRPDYQVRIVTPVLRAVTASSGADVEASGVSEGDFTVEASSGSDVQVSGLKGGGIRAHASSGSDLALDGSCTTLTVSASSGSDVDAGNLRCQSVTVEASSGSDVAVFAASSVTGKASSGSDVKIGGRPSAVQVEKSSGADVSVAR